MTEAVIYRNQSTDLRIKSMDWFLYDNGLRHERVKVVHVNIYEAKPRYVYCPQWKPFLLAEAIPSNERYSF